VAVLTPTASRAPRFPLLDSVRAIAALSVLVLHALVFAGATRTHTLVAPLAARLDVGVTIFFLLSGFLLYRPFVRARLTGERRPHSGPYAWRRVLRIVPAYWLALAFSALLLHNGVLERENIPTFFGFAQIYGDKALGGLPQAWSLCVEITFYAFLPLWAWLMRSRDGSRPGSARSELVALGVLAAAGVAYQLVFLLSAPDPSHANTPRALVFLPAYLDQFAIGMALAVLSVRAELTGGLPRSLGWLDRRAWPAWALAFAAFLLVSLGIGLSGVGVLGEPMTAAQALARHWLYAAVALGVLAPAVLGRTDAGAIRRRLLAHPGLTWLGLVSYGIYLWHYPVLQRVWETSWIRDVPPHPYVAFLAVGLAGGIVCAAISYYGLERPLLRLKRLVGDRQSPPHDPVTHAPLDAAGEAAPLVPVVAERAPGR
jgi:peptidoglycan/LPS O-acetylase OafA/YrhL